MWCVLFLGSVFFWELGGWIRSGIILGLSEFGSVCFVFCGSLRGLRRMKCVRLLDLPRVFADGKWRFCWCDVFCFAVVYCDFIVGSKLVRHLTSKGA